MSYISLYTQDQDDGVKVQQKFSKQVSGVGGLKVLNDGLLAQDKAQGMLSSYTNMKSELSIKDDQIKDNETNSLNLATSNSKFAMKSRSNITLIQNQQEHQAVAKALSNA